MSSLVDSENSISSTSPNSSSTPNRINYQTFNTDNPNSNPHRPIRVVNLDASRSSSGHSRRKFFVQSPTSRNVSTSDELHFLTQSLPYPAASESSPSS